MAQTPKNKKNTPTPANAASGRPAGLFTWLTVGIVVAVVGVLVIVKVSSGNGTQNDTGWTAADATVVAIAAASGQSRLVAYVATRGRALSADNLRAA